MITVYFDVADSAGNTLYTRLEITPYGAPLGYEGQVISADSVLLREFFSPATIELVPNSYAVRFTGRNTVSEFILTLPTSSDNTTVSASAFMAACPPYQGFTASYAITAGSLATSSSLPLWDAGYGRSVQVTSYNGVLYVT